MFMYIYICIYEILYVYMDHMNSYGSMMFYICWVSMFTNHCWRRRCPCHGRTSVPSASRRHCATRGAAGYNGATDGTGESHAAWWFQPLWKKTYQSPNISQYMEKQTFFKPPTSMFPRSRWAHDLHLLHCLVGQENFELGTPTGHHFSWVQAKCSVWMHPNLNTLRPLLRPEIFVGIQDCKGQRNS